MILKLISYELSLVSIEKPAYILRINYRHSYSPLPVKYCKFVCVGMCVYKNTVNINIFVLVRMRNGDNN